MSQSTKLASLSSKKQLRSLKRNLGCSSCKNDEKLEEDHTCLLQMCGQKNSPDDKMTSHRELRLTKIVGSTTDVE